MARFVTKQEDINILSDLEWDPDEDDKQLRDLKNLLRDATPELVPYTKKPRKASIEKVNQRIEEMGSEKPKFDTNWS